MILTVDKAAREFQDYQTHQPESEKWLVQTESGETIQIRWVCSATLKTGNRYLSTMR